MLVWHLHVYYAVKWMFLRYSFNFLLLRVKYYVVKLLKTWKIPSRYRKCLEWELNQSKIYMVMGNYLIELDLFFKKNKL